MATTPDHGHHPFPFPEEEELCFQKKRRLSMTMATTPGHGHHHFPLPEEEESNSGSRSTSLLLDEEAPNQFLIGPPLLEWEGVVVMVIHSLPLRSSPPLLGNGRDAGHGHTQPPSKKLSTSSWKGKGWWSWPYRAVFQKLSSSTGKGKGFLTKRPQINS